MNSDDGRWYRHGRLTVGRVELAPDDPVRPLLSRGSAHYRPLDPQPIEVIQAWRLPFDIGCIVKYGARVASGVNGLVKNLEDLDKVIHYAELVKARLERENEGKTP